MLNELLLLDKKLLLYLNNLGTENFDFFWLNVTDISTWIPLIVSLIVFIFYSYPLKPGLQVLGLFSLLLLLTLGLTDITKSFFERLRPNNDVEIEPLIRVLTDASGFSFFSGHASSSFAMTSLAIILFKKNNRWVWFLLFWPILFAYSRIYVGVHYPIDVLVGALIGVGLAKLVYSIYAKITLPD